MFKNFCNLPKQFSSYKQSKIVILPIPFEKTSSWIKGSNRGPDAIIEASQNLELYDIETASEVYKKGICTVKKISAPTSDEMITKVCSKTRSLLNDNKFVAALGGEHSICIGTIKAHATLYSKMGVLHLDAHTDMRNEYEGNRHSHACTVSRVKEITKSVVSVGIRSMDSSELSNIDKDNVFYAEEIRKSKKWIKKVITKLPRRVYITIDLDVFDTGIMPSTGTPEPGGLDWYQVTTLLKMVAKYKDIIGFDVVELCPLDNNKAPNFLAAKLIYKLLSYKFT